MSFGVWSEVEYGMGLMPYWDSQLGDGELLPSRFCTINGHFFPLKITMEWIDYLCSIMLKI